MPDVITDKVVEYCEMLRAWKIPVFRSTVIGHFQMLLGDSPLGSELKLASGSWDYTKLGYWYKRRFLSDSATTLTSQRDCPHQAQGFCQRQRSS